MSDIESRITVKRIVEPSDNDINYIYALLFCTPYISKWLPDELACGSGFFNLILDLLDNIQYFYIPFLDDKPCGLMYGELCADEFVCHVYFLKFAYGEKAVECAKEAVKMVNIEFGIEKFSAYIPEKNVLAQGFIQRVGFKFDSEVESDQHLNGDNKAKRYVMEV